MLSSLDLFRLNHLTPIALPYLIGVLVDQSIWMNYLIFGLTVKQF